MVELYTYLLWKTVW